jgi:chaperonin GroES
MITTKTKIKPAGNRFLIKLIEEPDKIGSIYTPDNAKNRSVEGTIVEVGTGGGTSNWEGEWPPFQMGERVLVGKWSGQMVELADSRVKDMYIVGVDEIIAALKD